MNPQFPIYIVSKGRWETRLTSKTLERMGVDYRIVVEQQERDRYAAVIDPKKILVLDRSYQRDYQTCDELGEAKGKGPGPARNFAWDHALASQAGWHWVMDDNIRSFHRLNHNLKVPAGDGTLIRCMEDFVLRYQNVAMAGPNYFMFASRKTAMPPFVLNTRIYSCNLIRNEVPYRWRGRYNEDTDLSLRMLKDGWCTVQFNAFLQYKEPTQSIKGGNTDEFYAKEGTLAKSRMQVALHPDVSELVWRFGRWHHHVDYRPFKDNMLIRADGLPAPRGVNNYGMRLISLGGPSLSKTQKLVPGCPNRSTSGSRPKDGDTKRKGSHKRTANRANDAGGRGRKG